MALCCFKWSLLKKLLHEQKKDIRIYKRGEKTWNDFNMINWLHVRKNTSNFIGLKLHRTKISVNCFTFKSMTSILFCKISIIVTISFRECRARTKTDNCDTTFYNHFISNFRWLGCMMDEVGNWRGYHFCKVGEEFFYYIWGHTQYLKWHKAKLKVNKR